MTGMARVLIIEDDPELVDWLTEALSMAGHHVSHARNGAQGLQLLCRIVPDLVILDIVMPEKDGLEVLQDLYGRAAPKIIAISGAPPPWRVLDTAERLGAQRTLSKPFSQRQLVEAVNEVLTSL
jgi:DNA-binding response OmpR family regulator